jgi:beta-glucanase (GH16 family)
MHRMALLVLVAAILGGAASPSHAQTQTQTPPPAQSATQTQSPDGAQPPAASSKWTLVWFDEFNGADGSRPDKSKWVYDIGSDAWGNAEEECYTDRADNSVIRGGNLVITARKESIKCPKGADKPYTSARLKTLGLFSQAYGRFEARIKVPRGQGMWPAFWMLGEDIPKVGWPASGEIDIMEIIGKDPSTAYGSLHGPGYNGSRGYRGEYRLPGTVEFADAFHTFSIEWEPNVVRFYVDDDLYATQTPKKLPPDGKWVFDHPFFIILNCAVGGSWPGSPDATTQFPQEMLIDYVRVYKRAE